MRPNIIVPEIRERKCQKYLKIVEECVVTSSKEQFIFKSGLKLFIDMLAPRHKLPFHIRQSLKLFNNFGKISDDWQYSGRVDVGRKPREIGGVQGGGPVRRVKESRSSAI